MTTYAPGAAPPNESLDFQIQSLFGSTANPSQLPAGSWDPANQDSSDIGAIIADGIRGTVNRLMNAAVGDAQRSGQLTPTGTRPASGQSDLMTLLLVGGLVYLLVKS